MLALTHQGLGSCAMEILFRTTQLAKVMNEDARLLKAFGDRNAKAIKLRLAVLSAAATLADVPTIPPDRRHLLKGERKGCFAVDAHHPFRVVFEPANDPLPRKADGGLDLAKITSVTILEVVDYH